MLHAHTGGLRFYIQKSSLHQSDVDIRTSGIASCVFLKLLSNPETNYRYISVAFRIKDIYTRVYPDVSSHPNFRLPSCLFFGLHLPWRFIPKNSRWSLTSPCPTWTMQRPGVTNGREDRGLYAVLAYDVEPKR